MNLKYVTFFFSNLDQITIDGKYVGEFLVDDFHTYISRIACNAIEKMEVAKTFIIEIHKDANIERYQHNQTHIEDLKQMTFGRLTGCDITAIEFELEEKYYTVEGQTPYTEHYYYLVDWNGDNDYYNDAQSNYISNDGHLYIAIAKGKSIDYFFDLESINDSKDTNLRWTMYKTLKE